MKKAKNILFVLFVWTICLYCLFFGTSVKAAVTDSISRCLTSVIPSLFAMMAVSWLLIRSGAVAAVGKYLSPVGKIFGMSGEIFAIFLFSMTAGYPVGARMIYVKYMSGELEKSDAAVLSGMCFGSGVPFIFGCVSANKAAGRLILTANIAAQLTLLLIMTPYLRRRNIRSISPKKAHFTADMLTDCVSSAGRGMADICFCIMSFSVIDAMLRDMGITALFSAALEHIFAISESGAKVVFSAFLDVTAVPRAAGSGYGMLPAAAWLIGFGGVCVFVQIAGIFRGRVSMVPMVGMRALAAVFSGIYAGLLMPLFLDEAVTAAAISGKLSQCPSPVPSVILVIMTAITISHMRGGVPRGQYDTNIH